MHDRHLLSLAYLTVQGCPPLEQVKAAAVAGYDAAGLRLIAPHGLELAHPIVGDRALVREIKAAAADLGISFLNGEVLTLLPGTDVREWSPVLGTAAEFGMPLMQITSEDPDAGRAADNLGRLADLAAPLGLTIAIEFMRWRDAATIEDPARLARASGRDNVGILLDALHLSRSGGSPDSVAALPQELMLYLQICDAPSTMPSDDAACIAEARGARMLPGEGGLWLRELMAVLPPDIAISIEPPHRGDAASSVLERAEKGMASTRRFLDSLAPASRSFGRGQGRRASKRLDRGRRKGGADRVATRPKGSLTDRVTDRIRRAILDGEIELGEALSEDKLATTLGVSRSPVRQALAMLEQQGLIDVRPQRGSFVFQPNAEDIGKICEFRRMVEVDALRLAMQHARKETLTAMKAAAERMQAALDDEDRLGVARAGDDFHEALLVNSDNPYLIDAYRLFSGKVAALRSHRSIRPTHSVANSEHFAIIGMLENGDLQGALDALGAHVLRMAERFRVEESSSRPAARRAARMSSLDHVGRLPD